MCAPSPPPAPDYAAAAAAQGVANVDAARTQGRINNPNVVSPTGTQTVTWDGDTPTLTQAFSPQEQAIYDQNTRLRTQLGALGNQGATSLGEVVGKNLDLSGLPSAPGNADANRQKIMDAMLSRSNKDIGDQQSSREAQLIAAGIPRGSEAWNKEADRFDRSRNDARNQAELSAGQEAQRNFGMDTTLRKDALAEYLTQRQTPLNEISALMSGSQVNNQFATPGYAQNTSVAPAPTFAGAQAQGAWDQNVYNQNTASRNGLTSGLFRLGSAFAGGM
jgi:hypothetical protein